MHAVVRIFIAVFAALASTGCARNPHIPPADTTFLKTSPDAIVVVGTRSATPNETFWIAHYRSFELVWESASIALGNQTAMSAFTIKAATYALGLEGGGPRETIWHVVRVPAGTYNLARVTAKHGYDKWITEHTPRRYTFTLKPGEVRYIGDLHFDVKSFPARLVKITRTDAMAKAELAKYPGIHVAPAFQAPSVRLSNGMLAMLTVSE